MLVKTKFLSKKKFSQEKFGPLNSWNKKVFVKQNFGPIKIWCKNIKAHKIR